MLLLIAAMLLQSPATEQSGLEAEAEGVRHAQALVDQVYREIEGALVGAGATDLQRRYFYCYQLAPEARFISDRVMAATPSELFPAVMDAVDNELSQSAAVLELESLTQAGDLDSLVDELAINAAPSDFHIQSCEGSMVPAPGAAQQSVDRAARCAADISDGLTPDEEPPMRDCHYANLFWSRVQH